jgi:MoaA/NifB/PqqE/SkfB family radical SAM enzyme
MTNLFPGGASFIYRKLFDRIGQYDPEMFVGWEDYELSIRAIYSRLPIKAHLIKDIELIHDHRSTRKIEDQKSILIRYDLNLNENSYYHMIGKYHLFGFTESNWKLWISKQIEHSLRKPNQKSEREKNIISFLMNKGNLIRLFVETSEKMIPGSIFWVLKYKLFRIKDLPLSCTLYITNKCNFKCPHCHRNIVGIEQFNEMTLTIVEKLVKLYPSITSFCVAGYGEPTLANEFVEIVNFLVNSGKTVGIITNGINSDKLLTLSHSPSYISISLNGYNNESYLENSRVPAYEKVIGTFLKLRSNFKNVGFSYILKRNNFRDLEKILPLLDKLKPNFLHLHNYLVYNIDLKEEIQQIITVEDTEIIKYINRICTGREYQIQKPIYVDFNYPRHNCKSYTYLINVNGDGNIGGCLRQKPPNASFGNLFREIDPFNSKEMCQYRAQMYKTGYPHKECRFCFGNWG